MTPLDENRQNDLVRRIRRAFRLGDLTPEQAQAEYDAAESVDLTKADVDRIVNGAFESVPEPADIPFEVTEWSPEIDTSSVEADAFQMNRNLGDDDEEVDEQVEQHRRDVFGEDDDDENSKDNPDGSKSR